MERPREPQAAGAAEQQQRRRSEQVCREQQQVAGQQEGKEKWKLAAPMEELETLIVCPVSTADKELEVHMANIAKLACTTPEGHCFGCLFLLKPGPNGLALLKPGPMVLHAVNIWCCKQLSLSTLQFLLIRLGTVISYEYIFPDFIRIPLEVTIKTKQMICIHPLINLLLACSRGATLSPACCSRLARPLCHGRAPTLCCPSACWLPPCRSRLAALRRRAVARCRGDSSLRKVAGPLQCAAAVSEAAAAAAAVAISD